MSAKVKNANWDLLWSRDFEFGPMDSWALQIFSELTNLIADLENPKILSAGCGRGLIDYWLLKTTNAEITFVDMSSVVLKKINRILKNEGVKKYRIHCGDILDLPFGESEFDIVWNEGVLEHFDANIFESALAEMVRVSSKYVLVDIPNSRSVPYVRAKETLESINLWEYGQEIPRPSLVNEFKSAGLTLIKERDIGTNQTLLNYINMLPKNYSEDLLATLNPSDFTVMPHLLTIGKKD